MTKFDYEKDMKIDPDALDIEWLEQASLALKYGKLVSDLRVEVKRLGEKVKTVRSELIRKANNDPEGCCNKAKPNAADIEAYYRSHDNYKQAVATMQEVEYELEFAELAKNEICYTRKAALENLVILHGQQYFAGPKVPRNISKEWEAKQKQKSTNNVISRSMNRKRKVK